MNNADNGKIDGGDGNWITAATNWTNATGDANSAYHLSTVCFGGDSGVVSVGGSAGEVTVQGMQFHSDGYVIQGDPLTLNGDVVVVQVGNNTAAGADITATISSILTGDSTLSKIDKGTLNLTGVNTYTGGTLIADGVLIGTANSFGTGEIYNEGTFVIDQRRDATLDHPLDGSGSFYERGSGTLILSGTDLCTGPTIIESGLLRVDGVIVNAPVTVQAGGSLGGNGLINRITLETNAVVAPGASIGNLTVMGDFTQASGSSYVCEISSSGLADQILITGSATISPDAILNVVRVDAGQVFLNSRYTVLTAGSLSGEYTLTGDTSVSAFLGLVANYDANNVHIDAVKTRTFASVGLTPNQISVGKAADTGQGGVIQALLN